ncbi:Ankyrin repeat [Novymonas esmeraldas]|uniref:Ankyrin repeat n=1 Tax=Novymonas esmeraldas TaxID=1808958 RepID=A0AAW0F949_9TRYP
MLVSLGHVCVAAFVGYLLAGLAGVWCLLRFRHLECLRRRRPWHCVAHYACYGVFLLYLVTAVSMRGSSDAAAPAAPAAASVWRTGLHEPLPPRRGRAIAQAPPSPHTALLGHAVREAFLHPWTRVPTGPPSATPAASRGAVSWARVLAEVAVQHIAATALFVSFVLLSNARWRYAVRRPARILASTTRAGNANEEEGDAVYSIGGTASVAPGEKGCCRRNSSSQHQDQQQQRRRQRQRQRPSQASSFALVEDSDSGGGDGDTAGLSRSTGGCSSSSSSSSSGGGGGGGVAGRTPSTPARNSRFGAPPAGTSQWRCVLRRARRRWWGRSSADGVPTRVPHTRQSIVRSALSAEVQQRLLSAPWLSDVAVAVIGALLFAVVAVARLAVAVAVASVWASTTSTQGVHGSAALASDAAAAALPSPTEGLVGLGGLLLLAVQRVRLRYSARLAEQLLAVTSASVHAARREQLRQRLLLARRSPRRPGPLRGGGELSRTGSADSVWGDAGGSAAPSVTPAPLPFRHVWTVAVLLCVVQVCPDSAWAWAVAVGLTAGCAVASLADAVVGPLREVVADYRQRVGGDGGALAVLCLSASAVSAALERRHARGRRGSLSSLSTTVAVDDSVHDDDNSDAAAAEWRSRHHSSSSGGGIGSTLGAYVGLERDTHPAASRSTEDQLAGESHIVSTSFAGSGATADAAAAASAVLGDSAACTFIGAEYSVVEDVLGDDAAGVADVAEAEAEAAAEAASVLSPMHFWDGVAAKAMQQSAAAAAAAGGADAGVGIASSLQGSFAGAGIAASLQGSFVGLRRRGDAMAPAMTMSGAEATFLGVTDPFAAVSATGPPTPLSPLAALGHLAPASTHFTRDNLKGSMLLSLPTVARLGGEAEAAAEAAAEVELLQQQQQQQQQASASMPAARDVETNSGDTAHAAGSPLADPVQSREDGGSGGGTDADVCEAPQDGWLARALATVVPSLAATRRSSGSGDGPAAATPTPSRHDSTSDGSGMSLTGSFASYTSAAARALIDSEEGFARFLDCVRRDGDNTYALQNLLSVHGHTYRQRVDATGRSAMHHAAMGGFVHGAVFLARIGAELNVLDSAGYAPLHYAVLHHTEVRLSPHITDESPSAAVHEARHILGIPVVATAAVQAPAQTQRRRRRRQQQQELEWVQAQLHAAYATTTSDEGRQAAAQAGSSADVNVGTTSASASVTRTTSVPSRGGSGLLSTRSTSRVTSPPTLATFPNDQQQQQQQEQQATASAAAAAAVMAAVVVPEEKGQWYGMVGALVRLGAQVDLATAKGLTALHLAVMQDSIGLVNTLLREGANPLLGSELETPSLASAMHATAWSACGSTGSSSSSDAGDGDDDSGPTGGSGGRGRGRGADATAAGVCRPQPSPAQHHQPHKQQQHQQHREWLEVHVTNAGNPIANGYCKSPLLLAVELDSDLVVASMLYHAALHATTAKAVAGLPQNPVSAPHVSPSPSASAAAAAAAASLVSTANDAAAPHLLHYTPLGPLFPVDSANASSLRSASAVAAPKSASPLAAAANPLSDHGVDEGGEQQQQQQQQQQQAVTAQTSTNSAAPLTSTSTITTTTTTLTTLASSQARKRVGQCCLHGLQPVHIALLLGNAQATRVLLLCWSYAEDAVPAAPADARLSREEQSLASSKAHKDLVDTVATLALPQSVEEAQRPATVAQVTLPAPQTATEMSSNSDGDGDSGAAAAAAAAASAAAAAAPPTATLRLVHATAGTGVLRTAPLHLNLFHLAAVGDSTECLAYVLRWRGAPDYIACALDEVFRDAPRDDAARRATTTATTTWHTTQDAYRRRRRQRRQQKRLCAQQGSHAAPSLAMAAMAPPPPRSEGAGQQHAAEVDEDPLHTQLSGTRPTGAVVAVVDVAGKTRSDGTVSPATSDVFNQTWSSGGPSAAERGSADTTSTTRRARRMRAKHQTFVRALLALLQTNGRGDAVRRRLRSTVLGTGAVLRRAARCSAAAEARGRSPQPPSRCVHDGDEEEGVGVCDVGGGAAAVEAATCYGSTAAAAALHTGMVECYATMGVPLHRRYRRRTQGGDGDGDGDGDDNGDNGAAPPSGPRALYVQAKELERVRRLRQQRVRAFASAVATLRQSIPGVPIDIAHLAAVEAAVDRVCAHTSSTTPATRRALQQALLVVTRRLQNQHRRTRLEHGLSRVTAAAAAAAAVAAATTSEAAEEEEEEDQTEDDEGGPLAATSSDRVRHDGAVRRGSSLSVSPSAHTRQLRQRRRGGAAVYGQSHHRRRSSSSSSSSHYRHRHDEDDHDHTGGGGAASLSRHDSLSSTAATADEAARRVAHEERRQQTLRLLRAIADEVNAVDACGLTPLHYAIAHENASMVYLLCAYGATFVFASEATETHLMKHPAEAVAAAVAEERHTSSGGNDNNNNGGGGGGGGGVVTFVAASAATDDRPAAPPPRGGILSSPATATAAWTSARAKLSTPAITTASTALSAASAHHHARLTPATRDALRRVAKAGNAEQLLRWMPTEAERAVEERQLLQQHQQRHDGAHAAPANPAEGNTSWPPPPQHPQQHQQHGPRSHTSASDTAETASATSQRFAPTRVQPTGLASVRVPSSTTTATAIATAAATAATAADPHAPTTMAATLTAALGIDDVAGGGGTAVAGDTPGAGAELRTTGDGVDVVSLRMRLVDDEDRALQTMVGGGGGSEGASCHAEGEGAADSDPLGPTAPATSLRLLSTAASSSTSTTTASASNAVASAAGGADAAAAAEATTVPAYTLLEPHDVYLTHVVRNPTTADSVVRAAMEGTALRYLHLTSLVAGEATL